MISEWKNQSWAHSRRFRRAAQPRDGRARWGVEPHRAHIAFAAEDAAE